MFRRNVDTLPRLHAGDETSSEHGASPLRMVFGRVRLSRQEAFVWVAAATEAVAEVPESI